ncbi:uncharacterized protein F4812DRAFT_421468 [Daldinia caldariorum]|uniref:uncharacterized protein n=1 Tax=Daldinia caldariorum TaxID=326644 RepID=UPI002007A7DA|nr:uncharacterized protein F4812DRAFT_421468 [Daldinia caldariorum]KAI1470086.1 hypothetical protein F4812DRAFT_421468 [Daldinia caldariorum]
MDSTASESTPVPPVIFRGKKRKTYRQRTESTATDDHNERSKSIETPQLEEGTPTTPDAPAKAEATTTSTTTQSSNAEEEEEEEEEKGLSVAEVLRLRNARKARLGGVKFGAGSSTHASNGDTATTNTFGDGLDDLSLMIREEENKALDIVAGVKKRFAPQTGMAAELVNKHMEEYIEAELARRHNAAAAVAAAATAAQNSSSATSSWQSVNNNSREQQQHQQQHQAVAVTGIPTIVTARPRPEQRNRALQGQLLEIDLGEEARSRNEALTERATRKLQGQLVDDEDDDEDDEQLRNGDGSARPKKKVRLGRDGKPWRPRNRRNSDDIKRDQIVEEILRESRLDVYETPTPPPLTSGPGANANVNAKDGDNDDGQAADDRIAEEFRREFMDAMAERRKRRKKASNAPAGPSGSGGKGGAGKGKGGGAADDEVLRGPKLGGSRNVRAAMRNLLLEKAKEAKGTKGATGVKGRTR